MMIDLPAPVSPVRTVRPGPNRNWAYSSNAKLRIVSSCNMNGYRPRQCSRGARRVYDPPPRETARLPHATAPTSRHPLCSVTRPAAPNWRSEARWLEASGLCGGMPDGTAREDLVPGAVWPSVCSGPHERDCEDLIRRLRARSSPVTQCRWLVGPAGVLRMARVHAGGCR